MITITQDGKCVKVKIRGAPPIANWHYEFSWEYRSMAFAALLAQNLRKSVWDMMQRIKTQAYKAGYRDGRRHGTRQDYFTGHPEADVE